MIEFGKTLREAREAKGFTPSQIADMTHLKISAVEGLENEDFSMIAAPIYGRGFVKLYCEAVGLEAKPLVEEFMAIINGNREIAIKERPIAAVPPPAPAPVPPPAPAQEPDLFLQNEPEPAPAPVPPSAPAQEPDLFLQNEPEPAPAVPVQPSAAPAAPAAKPTTSFARFAAPVREDAFPVSPSGLNPRIVLLAGCALALLVVLALGIRSLYRATTSDAPQDATPPAAAAETAAETPVKAAPAAKAAPRAQQQKIPPLYFD